ncbi:hypothetical protein Aperf_G00000052731 [Anoplocephala perfoliata]
MPPLIAYWNIRGLAEPIRLLLHYLGVEYDEKVYNFGPPPGNSREEWLSEKFKLGLDFPNLPYYIDGDYKLTQSSAIMEYIADTHNMVPTCKKHRAVLLMLHNDIKDFRPTAAKFIYRPHTDDEKKEFLRGLPDKLQQYENYLGDKEWLTGDKINYPDFSLCEILIQVERHIEPNCLKNFPKLKAYLTRFENLPQLRSYLASGEFQKRK